MAETTEREKREARSAGFTDGDYIPRAEAPKMPRVFSNADMVEPREPGRKMIPLSLAGLLCVLSLCLGLWIGSARLQNKAYSGTDSDSPRVPYASTVTSATGARAEVAGGGGSCLGISVQTVTAAAAEFYQIYYEDCLVQGVQIYAVGTDSPADRAGLYAGDIIVSLDGALILTSDELTRAERCYRAGEEAVCTIFRNGQLIDVPVVFAERTSGSGELEW